MDTQAQLRHLDLRALATEMRVRTLIRDLREVLSGLTDKLDAMVMAWAVEDAETAQRALSRTLKHMDSVFQRQPKPLTPAEQAAECEGRA